MNTLNFTITSQFYIDPDNGFNDITKFWKEQIANGHNPTSSELLSYAILRGKDYRKGFTKVTNSRKLENGMYEYLGFRHAAGHLRKGFAEIFQPFINSDANNLLKKILPGEVLEGYYYAEFPISEPYTNVFSEVI